MGGKRGTTLSVLGREGGFGAPSFRKKTKGKELLEAAFVTTFRVGLT